MSLRTIGIAGVGLIGGSFGLALRREGFEGEILGVSSPRTIKAAVARGAISAGTTLPEMAQRADLILLAQPISGILRTLDELGPLLVNRRILVTDVGSTKRAIEQKAAGAFRDALFVGGHPMAGKETRGVENAEAGLFEGRPWVLTSSGGSPAELAFQDYIEKFGARKVIVPADVHDRLVAWGSHLPQLLSTALASLLAKNEPGAAQIAGPGLTDMTRLAMSSFDLWSDILETNRGEIARALEAMIAELKAIDRDAESKFAEASAFAQRLRGAASD